MCKHSSTFLSHCGIKCRWKAGSDFPLGRSLINSPISRLAAPVDPTEKLTRGLIVLFIYFFFSFFLKACLRLLLAEGNDARSWLKNNECWKNNHSLTFIWTGGLDNLHSRHLWWCYLYWQNCSMWLWGWFVPIGLLVCDSHLCSKPVRLLSGFKSASTAKHTTHSTQSLSVYVRHVSQSSSFCNTDVPPPHP